MPWLISLTEWQAEVAERALAIMRRTRSISSTTFSLSGRTLTVPEDADARRDFVRYGIWPVEGDLDLDVSNGIITQQRKATLRKSMLSLEDKVEHPEHTKATEG